MDDSAAPQTGTSTSTSESMVLSWIREDCSLWVGGEVLLQVLVFGSRVKEEWSVRLKDGTVQLL